MKLEVILQDGPHGASSPKQPSVIARRDGRLTYNGVAYWEITLTLQIRGPVSWWKQGKNYFHDVVWLRSHPEVEDDQRRLTQDDFEVNLPETLLEHLNSLIRDGKRGTMLTQLPDSFIRTGVVHTTMETIHEILEERGHYNAGHWQDFCNLVRELPGIGPILEAA